MDERARERDTHETRRLLYVAMTRARDRLYVSASLKDGVLVAGRGSLAEVLPASLRKLFERAGAALDGVPTLAWQGVSGTTFEWTLCRGRGPAGTASAEDPPVRENGGFC
jgi:hypothetical protein